MAEPLQEQGAGSRCSRGHASLLVALLGAAPACGTAPASADASPEADADANDAELDVPGDVSADARDAGSDVRDAGSDVGPDVAPDPTFCGPEPRWLVTHAQQWNDPAHFGFTPNDGLVWLTHHGQWPQHVVRARDGVALMAAPDALGLGRGFTSVDIGWTRAALVTAEGALRLFDPVSGEDRGELEDAGVAWPAPEVVLSRDGRYAAAATCVRDDEGDSDRAQQLVTLYDAATLERLRTLAIEVDELTCFGGDDHPLVRIGQDGTIVAVPPGSGEAWVLDAAGERRGPFRLAKPIELAGRMGADVVELLLEPDGAGVISTGTDGRVRHWSYPDFVELDALGRVEAGVINQLTFAPKRAVAPIAMSRDGSLLARAVGRESIEVTTRRGEPVTLLEADFGPNPWGGPSDSDLLVAIAFSYDGRTVAALHANGVALWGCETGPAAGLPIRVAPELDGPARAEEAVGLVADFTPTAPTFVAFGAGTWALDAGIALREATWIPPVADEVEVRVIVDDGVRSGDAAIGVRVAP